LFNGRTIMEEGEPRWVSKRSVAWDARLCYRFVPMKERKRLSRWVPAVVIAGVLGIWVFGDAVRPFGSIPGRPAMVVLPSFVVPWIGRATVAEGVLSAPRNLPPIRNQFSYSLVDVDGRSILRTIPPFRDLPPVALVPPGSHVFRVRVAPFSRPVRSPLREEAFTTTVERGKHYVICSGDAGMILTEVRLR
jgi:hypothetical protein